MNVIEVKKSKFISYSFDVRTKEEVDKILEDLKQKHGNATHVCYAYILRNSAGMSDDGEPAGTAGKPLFNLLNIKNKTDKLVVVLRFYGGKKLGAGPLLRAYVAAAKEVL